MNLIKELRDLVEAKRDSRLHSVVDENDPNSQEYFTGTYDECHEWIDENEGRPEYKGITFGLDLAEAVDPSTDTTDQDDTPGKPRVIAKAGEYRVELFPTSEQVRIVDGRGAVRLAMPLVIWQQLTRQ